MTWIVVFVTMATLGAQPAGAEPARSNAAAVEEFRRIAVAHRDLRAYHLDIEATIETSAGQMPVRASVKCDERRRCLRLFLNSTTLETPELSLVVNERDRTITVAKREPAERVRPDDVGLSTNPEPWLQSGGTVSGGEVTAAGRHWVIATGKTTQPTVEIYVDPDTHLLRRLIYESSSANGRARVDIAYSWRDPAQLDPAEFEIGQFVQEHSGNLEPAATYAHYRLVTPDLR